MRVLIPLTLAVVLLIAAFVFMFVREARHRRAEDIARAATLVEDLVRSQLAEGVALMNSIMPLIMGDQRLVEALRARDRQALFDIAEPILKVIRARNRITHFYFILPDRTMLLRVQHPEEWGDRIDRFVLQEAQRTGRPFWGNEQGPFGTLTLRVVHPWHSGGQLIGYFELGQEFEDIMQGIHDLLDVDVFVSVDKKFFDREKWKRRLTKFGRGVEWDEFPSVIVLSRTRPVIPPPIAAYFRSLGERHEKRTFEVAWDDRVAQALVMPFSDLRQRNLGELVVLRDITGAASDARRAVVSGVAVCVLIGGTLIGFFFVLLGRVQRDVADRSSRLAEAQHVLAVANASLEEEIAERKRRESALRDSEARLETLARISPVGIFRTDADGHCIYVNPRWCEIADLSADDARGRGWARALHPDDRDRIAGEWDGAASGRAPFRSEYRFVRSDGVTTWVLGQATAERASDGTVIGYVGTITDIDERKRAEQRQATQFAVTRVLAESTSLGEAGLPLLGAICAEAAWDVGELWVVDAAGGHLRPGNVWSRPAFDAAEFTEMTHSMSFPWGRGLPGRVWASGRPAWIADLQADDNFPRAPWAARVGLHSACAAPIRSHASVWGVLAFLSRELRRPDERLLDVLADIGSQLGQFLEREATQEALRRSEEQLRQGQKMEAIGQLAGGIAHDFNNLLTVITGRGELLLDVIDPADPLRAHVDLILVTADRAASLTRQLLAFSRRQVLQPRTLNLNHVIDDMSKMLRRLIGENIELLLQLDPDLRRVRADRGQIEQVILNLAVNARDAMPLGGRLIVETRNLDIGGVEESPHPGLEPGGYVRLEVTDTGIGMDEATRARTFEPFFTTKGPGKGTGLGLATVYGIVQQSRGYVTAASAPGVGTTFTVYLPQREEAHEGAEPATATTDREHGSETILLVEDDDAVREVARIILERAGYAVLPVGRPLEVVDVAERHGGPIHLLLTDVVMPDMNGRQVAERLRPLQPDLRVLYMSGYTEDAMLLHGVEQSAVDLIPKPFNRGALLAKVREVLDAPRPGSG
jgi:PAS domain S-box-containing protein